MDADARIPPQILERGRLATPEEAARYRFVGSFLRADVVEPTRNCAGWSLGVGGVPYPGDPGQGERVERVMVQFRKIDSRRREKSLEETIEEEDPVELHQELIEAFFESFGWRFFGATPPPVGPAIALVTPFPLRLASYHFAKRVESPGCEEWWESKDASGPLFIHRLGTEGQCGSFGTVIGYFVREPGLQR